jgi:chromosomal replication initiation ATPase DnaA
MPRYIHETRNNSLEKALQAGIPLISDPTINATTLLPKFCKSIGVEASEILGPRKDSITSASRNVMYYLYRKMGYSFPDIGEFMNRDHSTVMNGVNRVKSYLDYRIK